MGLQRKGLFTKDSKGNNKRKYVELSTKRVLPESRKSKYYLVATHLQHYIESKMDVGDFFEISELRDIRASNVFA